MRTLLLTLVVLLATACGGSAAPAASGWSGGYGTGSVESESYSQHDRTHVTSDSGRSSSRGAPAPSVKRMAAPSAPHEAAFASEPLDGQLFAADGAELGAVGAVGNDAPQPREVTEQGIPTEKKQLLIVYTGSITLAVFNVKATQEKALSLVEEMGGYSSVRSNEMIVFRVPAPRFREALDALSGQGDVLSLDWRADEVTEQFRDIEIRLTNALEMRARLQDMLKKADKIEDMLRIEQQLERVTLEVEMLRGQLRSLSDRIAFSTITVYFSRLQQTEVPDQEYRLPFPWLNQLGLEFLLNM